MRIIAGEVRRISVHMNTSTPPQPFSSAPIKSDAYRNAEIANVAATYIHDTGEEFLKALLREETLQRHFEDTSLAFHKLPVENPGFNLRFKQTGEYKHACMMIAGG